MADYASEWFAPSGYVAALQDDRAGSYYAPAGYTAALLDGRASYFAVPLPPARFLMRAYHAGLAADVYWRCQILPDPDGLQAGYPPAQLALPAVVHAILE